MNKCSVGQPVMIDGITIIPLEEVMMHCDNGKNGIGAYAFKQPKGVVIITPWGRSAINIEGEQISLENCIRETEGLQQVLDGL